MSLYDETVPHFANMLTNVEAWLDLGVEHAKKKGFDPSVLLASRLAPDRPALPARQGHARRRLRAAVRAAELLLPRGLVYEILRHDGVDLGKRHFVTNITLRDL